VTPTEPQPDDVPEQGTPDLTLRAAGPDDVEPLAGLFHDARAAAYPAMPHPVHGLPEIRHWFREVLGLAPRTIPMPADRETWVAERDGEPVGYLVLDPEWLDSLYVRPDLTGQGIGSALLDLAKGLRPDGFGLWVFETNVRAQRFYRRHGLVVVRRTDGSDNEERAPDLEMTWFGADRLSGIRRRIDAVDERLAVLLNERALLTATAQAGKPVGGHPGRDVAREAEIVARMAALAPDLGPAAMSRIVQAVISASIDAATPEDRDTTGPAGAREQE
jgi:chorismate mutase/ribosomal protein S18 acetylase RimI-like enzyme